MANLANVVLHDQGHVGRHGERHLACQARRLCEHVQVPGTRSQLIEGGMQVYSFKNLESLGPAGEGEGNRLLHLNDNSLLFLVHIGGLGELDVASTNVAGGRELDPLLGAADHHRLTELREVPGQISLHQYRFRVL